MEISLASDHAGFELKEYIKSFLKSYELFEPGQKEKIDMITIKDFGSFDTAPVDYVDTGLLAAENVARGSSTYGILICGTGQGMNMIANKVKGIRASLCLTPEFAKLARQHNDANILVLAGRFLDNNTAIDIIEAFIKEPFSKEHRHIKRINKILTYENSEV